MAWRWSASQVDTFRSCKRKWYYTKVVDRDLPQTSSEPAEKGGRMHAWLANFFEPQKHEKPLDISEDETNRCRKALHVLPCITAGAQAEADVELYIGENKGIGFIDLLMPSHIIDYKTTKNFRYAKEEETLRRDAQVLSYGKWLLEQYPECQGVRFTWLYIATTGAMDEKPVDFTMTRKEIEDGFQVHVVPHVIEMDVLQSADVAAVEQNENACDDYGGCPFRKRCWPPSKATNAGDFLFDSD